MKTPKKIRVDLSTREALKALGRKGESYDAVIRRLINTRPREVDPTEWAKKWNLPDVEEEAEE